MGARGWRIGLGVAVLVAGSARQSAVAAPQLLVSLISATDAIQRYDASTGAPAGSFPALNQPRSMVLGHDGLLYVAKQIGNRIDRYNFVSGLLIGAFTADPSLKNPLGLAFAPSGNLFVGSYNPGEIRGYNGATGFSLGPVATDPALQHPSSLTVGPDGNLYVVNSDTSSSVLRFSGTGTFLGRFTSGGAMKFASSLVFGPDGHLYVSVTDDSKVSRFDGATGVFIDDFVPQNFGGLNIAAGLAFGPDGNLYVASLQGQKVLTYDGATGAFLGEFASPVGQASGIIFVDPDTVCGNGVLGGGEQCDLGAANGTPGACCTASCTFVQPGTTCRPAAGTCDVAETCSGFSGVCPADAKLQATSCDDGDPCTIGDACTNGICAGTLPPPDSSCVSAQGASLVLRRPAKAARRRLTWRWRGTGGVAAADFGSPATDTGFTFCLLDGSGVVTRASALPAGTCGGKPCWRSRRGRFVYHDPEATPDGVVSLLLKPGAARKSTIELAGSGEHLGLSLPLTLPVTARLQRSDGVACWESHLGKVKRNDSGRFAGR